MTCTLQQVDAKVLADAHTWRRAETIGRAYSKIYVQMTLMECPPECLSCTRGCGGNICVWRPHDSSGPCMYVYLMCILFLHKLWLLPVVVFPLKTRLDCPYPAYILRDRFKELGTILLSVAPLTPVSLMLGLPVIIYSRARSTCSGNRLLLYLCDSLRCLVI